MWMFAMFDLPVGTPEERGLASKFRNGLLDLGFEMAQFSVYIRHCAGKEKVETLATSIREMCPLRGSVYIFSITDKQYEALIRIEGQKENRPKNPGQLALF